MSNPAPAPQPGGFTFGAPNPAASQPAASNATSFNFGGTSTTANAPAPQQSATQAPAPNMFGSSQPPAATNTSAPAAFGSAGTATAPATATAPSGTAAPTPSFAFGSGPANTPAPGTFSNPPAPTPATGAPVPPAFGGSFSTGAPATTTTATPGPSPAPSGGFSLGGSAPTAATPSPAAAAAGGGFSFGGATSTTPSTARPNGLEVPDFDTIFPYLKICSHVRELLDKSVWPSQQGREAAAELIDYLKCGNGDNSNNNNNKSMGSTLVAPKPLKYTAPDINLRNQLQSNPSVVLPGDCEATLTNEMLSEVFKIADDLRISEREALALYAKASQDSVRAMLEDSLDESFIDKYLSPDKDRSSSPVMLGTNVVKAAKELYFYERQRLLRTILLLVQTRISASEQPWGNLVMEATDGLLQNKLVQNLIALVREWTRIIAGIEQELTRGDSTPSNSYGGFKKEKKIHFDTVHWKFALKERQAAAESLFYIAYHTQSTVDEIAGLVDLVKDLTNGLGGDTGLRLLNPFRDVPSAYEEPPQVDQPWAPYRNTLPPLKEKGHLKWQQELVKKTCQSSRPDLLGCVSALVMTIISALDTKQVLWDRDAHRWNSIGEGNMLCPPGEQSMKQIEPIHLRLSVEGCRDWERTDICGLLCGAYAMLLKTTPTLRSSPRAGGSSPSRSLMRTFGDCLSAPMALKSITFARLSLLPALQRPSSHPGSADSSEFFLSVLSEFVSAFMDVLSASGNLPISRRSWKKEQEEGLQLERENERQKMEFKIWSGDYDQGSPEHVVPSSVDLMKRPDCLDDIVALAVAVASLGPAYAYKFWLTAEEIDEDGNERYVLAPSRSLKKLKAVSSEDGSIPAFYLAFLAALAKAESANSSLNGADTVDSILANTTDVANYRNVFETIRWYVRQFNSSNASSSNSSSSSTPSTSYYYRVASTGSSTSQEATKSAAQPKPMDLGETNTFYLLSLLGLISNVSLGSAKARLAILSMKIPIVTENSSTVVGTDSTLCILFALLTAPLSPEVRGETMNAIASLLCMKGLIDEDKVKMREHAAIAWESLENCQILPIRLLDQYPQNLGENHRNLSSLRFPASSTSLAGSGTSTSRIPVDQNYGILYEMEHVESTTGVYQSTEGFLRLLNALFSCACPPDLGKHWRLRTGCTPYCEYVIDYVLPRATGSVSSIGKLPFRARGDQARLVALALEVIQTIVTRYSFLALTQNKEVRPDASQAKKLLGHAMLVDTVVNADMANFRAKGHEDFENKSIRFGQPKTTETAGMQNNNIHPFHTPSASTIPSPKSPGFYVEFDILSDGNLLKAIKWLLTEMPSAFFAIGNESLNIALSYAMYNETPPTLTSAKHAGKNETITPSMHAKLLQGLRPIFRETLGCSTAVVSCERCIIHALQILSASAVREESFYSAVNSASTPLRIVPVLRFEKRTGSTPQVLDRSAYMMRLKDLLLAAPDVVASIVHFVGYVGSDDNNDVAVAISSLALLYFIHLGLPGLASMQAICGSSGESLSLAVAKRLATSFERPDSPADSQILSLVFDWILSDLRKGERTGLAHVLLGIPDRGIDSMSPAKAAKSCFDVVLKMLGSSAFILDKGTSNFAAKCFEIITRLCDLKSAGDSAAFSQVLYCMDRLRSLGFWRAKLDYFLQWRGENNSTILDSAIASRNVDVINAISWFLGGLATELHVLKGFCPPERIGINKTVGYLAPRLGESGALLYILLGAHGHGIEHLMAHLPIERALIDDAAHVPSQHAIRTSMRDLEGSPGYQKVDVDVLLSILALSDKNQEHSVRLWGLSWNFRVDLDCSVSHFTQKMHDLSGVVLEWFDSLQDESLADGLAALLISILERLLCAPATSELSTTATMNLSRIILLLSQKITSIARDSVTGLADLGGIRNLLGRAVCTLGHHFGGFESASQQERTAILCAAFVEMMMAWPHDIEQNLLLDVALVLTKLSTQMNDVSPANSIAKAAVPSIAAMIARSSLATLLEVWDEDVSSPQDSLAYFVLSQKSLSGSSRTNAKFLLELLAGLDEGIVVLFEKFLQVPFVGDLLLDEGLIEAMSRAAITYMNEERSFQQVALQQIGAKKFSYGFPPFLLRHLELFRTLMATSPFLSEAHRHKLPHHIFDILNKYDHVIERAARTPSSHGRVLCTLAHVVAEGCVLNADATKFGASSGIPLQPVANDRIEPHEKLTDYAILDVCSQICEQPLEQPLELPYSLAQTTSMKFTTAVPVSITAESSWWASSLSETGREKSGPSRFEDWTEEMFDHAILGANILDAGLDVLMNLPLKSFSTEMSFVRGLFQVSKAAQLIESHLELYFRGSPQIDFMETETVTKNGLSQERRLDFMRKLGRRLHTCTEKILMALVYRAKQFQQEPENRFTRSVGEYIKAISDVLDHTEIESQGIACSLGEERAFGKQLAGALREHLTHMRIPTF